MTNNKMTGYACAALIAIASVTGCSMRAKAGDFTVTTTPTYNGGWQTTYRDIGTLAAGDYGNDGTLMLQGPAPANRCDQAGRGGFEIVTSLHAGERVCMGRR